MNHLSIDISRRLMELGAFKDWEFKVGNWVCLEGRQWLVIEVEEPTKCLRVILPGTGAYNWVTASEAVLLSSLDDILDEIRKQAKGHSTINLTMVKGGFAHVNIKWYSQFGVNGLETPRVDSMDETPLLSAAKCLMGVLEGEEKSNPNRPLSGDEFTKEVDRITRVFNGTEK